MQIWDVEKRKLKVAASFTGDSLFGLSWSPDSKLVAFGAADNNVRAVDVSPENDWSEVRVWYAPIQGLGTTPWPTRGFIYNRPAALGAPAPATVRPARYQQQVAQVFPLRELHNRNEGGRNA